jgi:hypothetical protein
MPKKMTGSGCCSGSLLHDLPEVSDQKEIKNQMICNGA